jgi:simple sugar transport system ATP-binding protein
MTIPHDAPPLVELRGVSKSYGAIAAITGVDFRVRAGEVICLLGDNGAGKSTLIKILAGVHRPDSGTMFVAGKQRTFADPREAINSGIATVYQDLSMIPLMSVTRNFFLGAEPKRVFGPIRWFDRRAARRIALEEVRKIGIDIADPGQLVGTLSAGQRQAVAIARARYFGARLLILDEPTAALGVRQAEIVLTAISTARAAGIGVVFITHNIHHATAVADRYTILSHGHCVGTFRKEAVTRDRLLTLMSGGLRQIS